MKSTDPPAKLLMSNPYAASPCLCVFVEVSGRRETRSSQALAAQYHAAGHLAFGVFAPCDLLNRRPRAFIVAMLDPWTALPDCVVPLGRTVGIQANGAVSNGALSVFPRACTPRAAS